MKNKRKKAKRVNHDMKDALSKIGKVKKGTIIYKNY